MRADLEPAVVCVLDMGGVRVRVDVVPYRRVSLNNFIEMRRGTVPFAPSVKDHRDDEWMERRNDMKGGERTEEERRFAANRLDLVHHVLPNSSRINTLSFHDMTTTRQKFTHM